MELYTLVCIHHHWCCCNSACGVIPCPRCRLLHRALPFYLRKDESAYQDPTTVRVTPLKGMRVLTQWIWMEGAVSAWVHVCVCVCVRTAPFCCKHCWQLSIQIKSHVTAPSVCELRSSVKFKIVCKTFWIHVWVCGVWVTQKGALCWLCGSCGTHLVTDVWQAPKEMEWCTATDKNALSGEGLKQVCDGSQTGRRVLWTWRIYCFLCRFQNIPSFPQRCP